MHTFSNIAVRLAMSATASVCFVCEAAAEIGYDALGALAGRWEVFNPETGKWLSTCAANPLEYSLSPDRKSFESIGTGADGKIYRSRYLVLQVQPTRVLTFIEGEKRLTDKGDPVVWWAMFEGPNRFRWRRYDWAADGRTVTVYRRCR